MDAETHLAERIVRWCEAELTYPHGEVAGKPVSLLPHERRFIEQAFADDVVESALSMPRGNSKTGLCAMIAAAAIVPEAPLVQSGGTVILVAAIMSQAKNAFSDVVHHVKTAAAEHIESKRLRVTDTVTMSTIRDMETGAQLRVIGSDPDTAHGLRCHLAILDEPAKWKSAGGRDEKMYTALTTAFGKLANERLIAIGTRPERDGHFFERLLSLPSSLCFSAPADTPDDMIGEPEVYEDCNPLIKVSSTLRGQIKREAQSLDTEEARARFKALRLNMGTPELSAKGTPFIPDWSELPTWATPSGGYVLGLDAGSRTVMSAATAVWGSGHVDCRAAIGREAPDLPVKDSRLIRDTLPVPSIGKLLDRCIAAWGEPIAVVADNYRSDEVREACTERGLWLEIAHTPERTDADIEALFGSLSDLIRPDSPLLDYCIAGARMTEGAAGRKLARSDEGGREKAHRDDPVAALILAAGKRVRLLQSGGMRSAVLVL